MFELNVSKVARKSTGSCCLASDNTLLRFGSILQQDKEQLRFVVDTGYGAFLAIDVHCMERAK